MALVRLVVACLVLGAAVSAGDRDVADFLFNKAEKAWRAKEYESAAKDYARARDEYRPFPEAAFGLGRSLEKLGRHPEAIAAYRQCITEVDAAESASWKWKNARRKSASAVKRLRRKYADLDRLNRDLIKRCLEFGREYRKSDPEWALEAYRTVLKLDPAHVEAQRMVKELGGGQPKAKKPAAKAKPKTQPGAKWGRSLVQSDEMDGWSPGLEAPWTCAKGVITADVEGRSGKLNWLDDQEFDKRFEIRARVRVARDGGDRRTYGFMLGDGRDWHAILVEDSNQVVLVRSEGGRNEFLKDAIPRGFKPKAWHTFRMVVDRNILTVYLNGKKLFEHTADDLDAFDGKIALFAQNGRFLFDRLAVKP